MSTKKKPVKKTLKQKAQALWMGFWCAVDGVSKFRLFMVAATLAVVLWLVFVA